MASNGLSLVRRAAEAVRRTPRWKKGLVFFAVGCVQRGLTSPMHSFFFDHGDFSTPVARMLVD
jgi:hypothetical protein